VKGWKSKIGETADRAGLTSYAGMSVKAHGREKKPYHDSSAEMYMGHDSYTGTVPGVAN
jgi:hypothetical protein